MNGIPFHSSWPFALPADPGVPGQAEGLGWLVAPPHLVDVLAREAAIAREDEARLEAEAIDLAGSVVLESSDGARVEVRALTSLHPALAARVARVALTWPLVEAGIDDLSICDN